MIISISIIAALIGYRVFRHYRELRFQADYRAFKRQALKNRIKYFKAIQDRKGDK